MKKIALLSCDSLEGYFHDDHLFVEELKKEFDVSTVSWSSKVQWKTYDAVVIRTTWDYVQRQEEFLQVLMEIQRETKLFNSSSVVNWNIHKYYLKELEHKRVTIVPTRFFDNGMPVIIPKDWTASKVVLKPAISATAFKTAVLDPSEIDGTTPPAVNGGWMLQPYLEQITRGEASLIFFDKKFSHALTKFPKVGDFRVQEEFGGSVIPLTPTPAMLEFAESVVDAVDFPLLYARVDLVPSEDDFALMELELIEPSLYFGTHPAAAKNFVAALRSYL